MAILGIDLGTTNSLVSVFADGKPRLIPNVHGEMLTPSVVGVDDDGTMLVGRPARERLLTHPDRSVAAFKRFMGTAHVTRLGRTGFRPEELSAFVLRSLKADAEAHLGESVEEAIISVPAYFNVHQRKATMDAGHLAGLSVKRVVNEPTAAALAYGLGEAGEGKYLVFDLGGGTFDVSILDKYEGVMEVRATTGDTQLGGNDFTLAIEQHILAGHRLDAGRLSPGEAALLRRSAEALKLAMTAEQAATYAIAIERGPLTGELTRETFERLCEGLLRRLRAPVERAIADSRLAPAELDAVILVGGATRMPMVRSLVARLFGRLPFVHVDPDTTVALGAAVQAGLVGRAAALEDVVMTDVCPHTLGIAVAPDRNSEQQHISPLIQRNAIVPISRSNSYSTLRDNQRAIKVEVYQGENLRPHDNVHVGTLEVPVPPGPAGRESVDVRFTYDINGALEVEVTVLSTNIRRREIFRNNAGLSQEDLETRFAALASIKLHPRERLENRTLIARAERLYAENLGEQREAVRDLLQRFEHEIAGDRLKDVEAVRAAFARALDAFEPRGLDW